MQRVLSNVAFAVWWREFSPKGNDFTFWLQPAHVADLNDPKTVHLVGLNLSRAWCINRLAPLAPAPQSAAMESSVPRHLDAAMRHVAEGSFAGTHWLASFAVLALTE